MTSFWQRPKGIGCEDMVLLSKIQESAIMNNLKDRFMQNLIYTYIGPVLIAVNPFKELKIYSDKDIDAYQGAGHYENPPHIFALSDNMFRNMMIDMENQCVIISGESGAGKTVSAKLIMNYISKVSGGGQRVEEVKNVILQSNPLLEAFGNAKTTRNNNSSRFGKYVEIQFSRGGEPIGGKISQFLLEKSRVVLQNDGERSFHIFYQMCNGIDRQMKDYLQISRMEDFLYISQSGVYTADGIDDKKEFHETMEAMNVMKIDQNIQTTILSIVAGIMHLGNVTFVENGNYAAVNDGRYLAAPARLLGIDPEYLGEKITSRIMETTWGSQTENIQVQLNCDQAGHTRDALAKAIYTRLFDYIVEAVNRAMEIDSDIINIGILDIYGFEIFQKNGFEQFCINYVNEKLQQIFIELTLKAEQEEYKAEGIQWKPIAFFNNKVVCDMIESNNPVPGVFSILNDVCATMHAVKDNADRTFIQKMSSLTTHYSSHYHGQIDTFTVIHYAGEVRYDGDGFCERNRDQLNSDLIQMMQTSNNQFIRSLFPDKVTTRQRPTTAGTKIRTQANSLVDRLMKCTPHYIRCIKPNETKRPLDWDDSRCLHQVTYLGLKENINVRRAGFAYRRPFEKFVHRYGIICKSTKNWRSDFREAIKVLMNEVQLDDNEWQIGKTKLFIKNPDSLFCLEERREREYDRYARIIQKAFRSFNAVKYYLRLKTQAADLLYQKKERRKFSLNRNFYGDYLFLDDKPGIRKHFTSKKEKVHFADSVKKYDRRFKPALRDLVLTDKYLYLVGREKIKKGPNKGTVEEVIKRRIEIAHVLEICMSALCDNFVILRAQDDYDSFLEVDFKTEFVTALSKVCKEKLKRDVPLSFSNQLNFSLKKEGWGGGGTRQIRFVSQQVSDISIKSSGKTLTINVPPGLSSDSRPGNREPVPGFKGRPTTRPTPQSNRGQTSVPNSQPQYRQQTSQPKGQQSPAPNKQAPPTRKAPVPPRPRNPKPALPKVRTLWPYESRDVDELSFQEGDIIDLIKKDESGWWTGRLKGKQGLFPSNYVEEV